MNEFVWYVASPGHWMRCISHASGRAVLYTGAAVRYRRVRRVGEAEVLE
jgi:hypothetical protein